MRLFLWFSNTVTFCQFYYSFIIMNFKLFILLVIGVLCLIWTTEAEPVMPDIGRTRCNYPYYRNNRGRCVRFMTIQTSTENYCELFPEMCWINKRIEHFICKILTHCGKKSNEIFEFLNPKYWNLRIFNLIFGAKIQIFHWCFYFKLHIFSAKIQITILASLTKIEF